MDSYMDRVGKFNDMVSTTNQHIKAVQDAATKFKDANDPVGMGLEVTGASAGGLSTVAGGITAIQHFKDFKTMYKGISGKLSKVRDRVTGSTNNSNAGRGGDANNPDPVQNPGGNAADGNAPQPAAQPNAQANAAQPANNGGGATQDVDGGVQSRIDSLDNNPFPSTEANSINNAINQKVGDAIGTDGKAFLNGISRASGRGGDPGLIKGLPEGAFKVDAQKDFLGFKNKVANDAIARANSGQTQASGYDNTGNPTGDLPGPQPNPGAANAVQNVPDANAVNPVAAQNNVALAPDANAAGVANNAAGDQINIGQNLDQNAQGIIARGRAALQNLQGGQQVPGRAGQAVQGLRANGPGGQNDVNAQANAGARVQQQAGDDAQGRLAPGRNPNGNPASAGDQPGAGVDGGGQGGLNPGQGANAGANAADADGSAAANAARGAAAGAGEDAAGAGAGIGEGLGIGEGIDAAAAFAGPAAPIIGLIGGLVSLGTTIAGLFHKKPPPVKEAPPPAPVSSVGGNLKDSLSGMGAGIF